MQVGTRFPAIGIQHGINYTGIIHTNSPFTAGSRIPCSNDSQSQSSCNTANSPLCVPGHCRQGSVGRGGLRLLGTGGGRGVGRSRARTGRGSSGSRGRVASRCGSTSLGCGDVDRLVATVRDRGDLDRLRNMGSLAVLQEG